MADPNFKYCALHYLNLWLTQDKAPCEVLAGNNPELKLQQLKKAATAYRVARNLPRKYDKEKEMVRYDPILQVLDSLEQPNLQRDPLVPWIEKVRDQISANYGNRDTLSLTTKFLWLKFKSPIIIFDSQARQALARLCKCPLTSLGNLAKYYSLWREEFGRHEQEIRDACASLPGLHEYAVDPGTATRDYVAGIASQQWFRERVFDVWLWHRGDKEARQTT